ncbi:signal peptidase I [Rickettsiales bacterium]|nr:signal peptidase I [Rickettsiales bacterium]
MVKNERDNNKITKEKEEEGGLISFIKTIAFAAILALSIRSILYEPFHIPSSSMKPGLLIGDYIFVSKMSYGYGKYSFPLKSFNLFDGRIAQNLPKRGDVAVFRLPSDDDINYIKRIIGIPGDIIKVSNGQLFVNGAAIKKEYKGEFREDGVDIAMFEEILYGKKFKVLDQYIRSAQDNTPSYKVPNNHYFVMGDNRDNSQDSRYQMQVGFIPFDNFIGRATMIFFSSKYPIWKFWKWPDSIRTDRIFQRIK